MTHPVVHILDDDESIRSSLSLLIRCWGFDVRTYVDGTDLLSRDVPQASDILLLDVRMPGISGIEVMDALTELGCKAAMIVMTGHGDEEVADAAHARGAAAYLEKPFDGKQLQLLIRSLAGR